jgi:putative endonuclease
MEGETAAYFHLRRKGYVVTARRWKVAGCPGDLDLVAWQGPVLCVVEVKTRTAHDFVPAHAAVDEDKRRTLRRLARQYLRRLSVEPKPLLRFDILSVYLLPGEEKEFEHYESAFGWSERAAWDRWGDRE